MKRILSIIPALAFVLVFSFGAFAQTNLDQNITATAEVVSSVQLSSSQNANFGNIPQDITSTTPTLNPTDNTAHSNISGGTPQLGYIEFTGTSGTTLQITNPNAVKLTESNSGYTVDFTPNLCYEDGSQSGSDCSGTAAGVGNDITVDGSTLSFTGTATVWVGGELDNPLQDDGTTTATSLPNGTYQNTNVTISVDYTF